VIDGHPDQAAADRAADDCLNVSAIGVRLEPAPGFGQLFGQGPIDLALCRFLRFPVATLRQGLDRD
jgi:hypothetical protein